MKRQRSVLITYLMAVSILSLALLSGCPRHIDSLYGLKVAADGAGGAVVIYEDTLGGDIYGQKISPEGNFLWGEKGVRLGSGKSEAYSFFNLNIVSDNSGGAIVVWPDSSQDRFRPTSHLARVDVDGRIRWQRDFILFNQVVSDGSGDVIIAFDDSTGIDISSSVEKDLVIVKIDSQGNYSWGIQGVTVPRKRYVDNTLQFLSDGSGGVVVAWEEMEIPPNPTPGVRNQNIYRLFAQRVDDNGELLWGDTLPFYATPAGTWIQSLNTTVDENGGMLASWLQFTDLSGESNGMRQSVDIAAQKIDASGNIMWPPQGVALDINQTVYPDTPALTVDGSGGATIVWRDHRKRIPEQNSLFAQRIDAGGNLKWQPGGVEISSTSLNPRAQTVSDGSGGVLAVYSFEQDGGKLHIQKLDAAGKTAWQENGISSTVDGFAGHTVVSDGQGGAIVGWGMAKSLFKSEQAFIQRVGSDGRLIWGAKGINLNQ